MYKFNCFNLINWHVYICKTILEIHLVAIYRLNIPDIVNMQCNLFTNNTCDLNLSKYEVNKINIELSPFEDDQYD